MLFCAPSVPLAGPASQNGTVDVWNGTVGVWNGTVDVWNGTVD